MDGVQSILASISWALDPLSIIRIYSYRFRIKCTFRELKQQVGRFCYYFCSKHMPKLNCYQKKGEPVPLERVEDEKSRRKVLKAIRATEMLWHCLVLQWGCCKAFPFILLERSVLNRSIIRVHLSKEGFWKTPLCIISGNIFSVFWGKSPNYA